jgi:hypothetical protein
MWAAIPLIDRFESKYAVDDNDCWIWKAGLKPNGYAQFWDTEKVGYGHRWSYTYFKGEIPNGLQIDHLCRVRSCVNPDHLEAVTMQENVARGELGSYLDTQKTKSHCDNGHEYTPENSYQRTDISGRRCRECKNDNNRQYRKRKALR